jgi:hypothetical protein
LGFVAISIAIGTVLALFAGRAIAALLYETHLRSACPRRRSASVECVCGRGELHTGLARQPDRSKRDSLNVRPTALTRSRTPYLLPRG